MTTTCLFFANRFVKSYPNPEDVDGGLGGQAAFGELAAMPFPADSHFVAYNAAIPRRLSSELIRNPKHKDLVDQFTPHMVLAVFDVDAPNHTSSDDWWEIEDHKLDDLLEKYPGGYVYSTRGGYRVVYALPEPFPIRTSQDAQTWTLQYKYWVRTLELEFGILADKACADWTRLYRLPRVYRDGEQTEPGVELGDAHDLGVWPVRFERVEVQEAAPAEVLSSDVTGSERDRRRGIYAAWLRTEAPIARQGEGGDATLFRVVQYGAYDLALPDEDVYELLRDHYDARCEPPWGAELRDRVRHKARDAKTRSTRPRKTPLLAEEAAMLGLPAVDEGLESEADETPEKQRKKKKEKPNTIRVCGVELQYGGWGQQPEPPVFLVQNFLLESKVGMIYADPGTIKSWTVIDLAIAVATGTPWLDTYMVKQGNVLFIDFEDGYTEFHRRVWMLSNHQEVPNLYYHYPSSGHLSDRHWWATIEKLVDELDVKLVIVDTLAAGTPGVDENEKAAADPLTFAGQLTEATDTTVVFTHHANKSGGIRGTSAFRANVDILFHLTTIDDSNGRHQAKLLCDKSGYKKPTSLYLSLDDSGLREVDPPNDSEAEKGGETASGKKQTLEELLPVVRLYIEQHGPVASHEFLAQKFNIKNAEAKSLLSELSACGEVYKEEEGYFIDNENKRRARVKDVLERNPMLSRKNICKEARIAMHQLEALLNSKFIRQYLAGSDTEGFVVS